MIDKLLLTCLQRNKRLVVPTLGAFIRKSIDGVGVILVFVPFLNKDDGVLLNAFREWAGVSKEDAQTMMDEYVAHIKTTLATRGGYVIEGIGVLKYDANNSLYLAKDGLPKKEEKTAEKETKVAEKPIEIATPKPVATHVLTPKPEDETIQPIFTPKEPKVSEVTAIPVTPIAPEPQKQEVPQQSHNINFQFTPKDTETQPNNTLNSQFSSPVENDTPQQSAYTPKVEDNIAEQQNTSNVKQPISYKKVVTGNDSHNTQRGNSNIGDFYYGGGESATQAEVTEPIEIQQNEQPQYKQQQVSYPQPQQAQSPNSQTQQQSQYRGSGTQNLGNRPGVDKNKVGALYASNKRTASGQHQTSQQNRNTVQGKKPIAKRPVRKPVNTQRKNKENTKLTFSAKLIWILAVVAIVLTILVIIYAIMYGNEVPLNEQVQVQNIEQITEPNSI